MLEICTTVVLFKHQHRHFIAWSHCSALTKHFLHTARGICMYAVVSKYHVEAGRFVCCLSPDLFGIEPSGSGETHGTPSSRHRVQFGVEISPPGVLPVLVNGRSLQVEKWCQRPAMLQTEVSQTTFHRCLLVRGSNVLELSMVLLRYCV